MNVNANVALDLAFHSVYDVGHAWEVSMAPFHVAAVCCWQLAQLPSWLDFLLLH